MPELKNHFLKTHNNKANVDKLLLEDTPIKKKKERVFLKVNFCISLRKLRQSNRLILQ